MYENADRRKAHTNTNECFKQSLYQQTKSVRQEHLTGKLKCPNQSYSNVRMKSNKISEDVAFKDYL